MSLAFGVIVLQIACVSANLVHGPNTWDGCALEFEYADCRTGKNNDIWSTSAF